MSQDNYSNKPLIHDDMSKDEITYRRAFVWGQDQIEKHGLNAYMEALIPQLQDSLHTFPEDHPIHELLSRWDPKTRTLRDGDPEPWR
jgi:hypothetical protein